MAGLNRGASQCSTACTTVKSCPIVLKGTLEPAQHRHHSTAWPQYSAAWHSKAQHGTAPKHRPMPFEMQERPCIHKKVLHSSQHTAASHLWQSSALNALLSWHKALSLSLACPSAWPTLSTDFLEPLHIRLLELCGLSLTGRGPSQLLPQLKGKGRIHCGLAFRVLGLPARVCKKRHIMNISAAKSGGQGGTAVSLVMLVLQKPHASSLPTHTPPPFPHAPLPPATFPQPAAANLETSAV